MSYGSPYSSGTPLRGDPGYYYDVNSPSPTPSPHHYQFYPAKTPQRPATRAHHRGASNGNFEFRPTTAFSPRYTSTGEYATGPSPKVSSRRKQSFSQDSRYYEYLPSRHERRHSHSYYRASPGESDEDEVFEVDGITYVLPAKASRHKHHDHHVHHHRMYPRIPAYGTDDYYNAQGFPPYYEKTEVPRYEDIPARSATRVGHHPSSRSHSRRPSEQATPPQRSATAKPSMQQKKAAAPVAKATEADARRHKIPTGYSLKNWDPSEEPIMLLGSVFDANSLGKWIYDWTVYTHGPSVPISDMAGDLWLLLIQLSGKVKRSEDVVPRIRTKENRELVEDFIASGDRLMDKLRSLLKRCEAPMLKASKRKESAQLGKNSGTEFVECLFGVERELDKTEKFMQSVRLWNLRFDANCEEILKKPTA
ncbi:vegetative cell wall protein gp1 [Microdochium bolleyi]|uniref:Vegetative cell wall protein gp1 n=1 Tax=Microdochium bolleyi TaxID=196109 RepID=A0A136IUV8_9PEZI|nr:vegetative cell wall protein gp1 [Microdochium bolleyi]